jgi:hypothetical protein
VVTALPPSATPHRAGADRAAESYLAQRGTAR